MKNFLPLLLCFALAFLNSCIKEPVAEISANKTEVETNESVQFSNSSEEALSYEWDFDDGSTKSTDKAPSHSWSSSGIYSVKMTAFSKKEKKQDEATITITVNDLNKKFIGTWNVSESYVTDFCGSGTVPYGLVIIAGSSGDRIIFQNLGENWNVSATISGNNFTMLSVNGIFGFDGDQYDFDYGSGSLSGNTLSYSFTVDDILYDDICGWEDYSGSGTK